MLMKFVCAREHARMCTHVCAPTLVAVTLSIASRLCHTCSNGKTSAVVGSVCVRVKSVIQFSCLSLACCVQSPEGVPKVFLRRPKNEQAILVYRGLPWANHTEQAQQCFAISWLPVGTSTDVHVWRTASTGTYKRAFAPGLASVGRIWLVSGLPHSKLHTQYSRLVLLFGSLCSRIRLHV